VSPKASLAWLLLLLPLTGNAQDAAPSRNKEAFQKVCGVCHPLESAVAPGRSREKWQETVTAMISRGAKATDEEIALIVDYLSANYGPAPGGGRGPAMAGAGGRGPRLGPGPADKHVVDPAAAERGRKVYAAECITCHGTHARGSDRGADLIRSVLVLHDRYGSEIGPLLKKGHPTQTTPSANLTTAQVADVSHFIHQEVYNTLRAALEIQNVLTGDPKAGAAYFNGAGKCSGCHSPTGDLAGYGKRFEPAAIQQRFLFPGGAGRGGRGGRGAGPAGARVTVTVTPPGGAAVTGTLLHLDDFNVALRDASGEYRSFQRTPSLKVVKNDPFASHHELLDQYTDKNIHDIVAYLESLK
jgi:mono/diheme cytochrome c family protein